MKLQLLGPVYIVYLLCNHPSYLRSLLLSQNELKIFRNSIKVVSIKSKIVSVVTNGQSAEGGGQMVRGRGLQEDERRHGGYLAVDMVDMVDCRYFWVSWYLIQKWIYCTSDILLSWRQEAEGAGVSDFLLPRPRLGWGTLSQPLGAVLSAQTYFHMMAFWLSTLHWVWVYWHSFLTMFVLVTILIDCLCSYFRKDYFDWTSTISIDIIRTKYRSLCSCSWQLPVLALWLWSRIKNSSSLAPPSPPATLVLSGDAGVAFVFEGEMSGFSDTLLLVLVTGWLVGDTTVI